MLPGILAVVALLCGRGICLADGSGGVLAVIGVAVGIGHLVGILIGAVGIIGLLRRVLLLVVLLGWVLFRFTQFPLAGTVLRGLFGGNGNPLTDLQSEIQGKSNLFLLLFCCVVSTPIFRRLRLWLGEKAVSGGGKTLYQAVFYGILPGALLLVSTAGLVGNSYNPFLYFKF